MLEGLDGAGTTTQAGLLDAYFRSTDVEAWFTFEPTDHPIGTMIREGLSGDLESPSQGKITLSETALCLLFAADRVEHSHDIEERRKMDKHVVSDRYVLSSIAYQSLAPQVSAERVIEVNRGIAVPDVTFLLDVPVDECLARLDKRSDSPTVYEKKDILNRIAQNYEATLDLYVKSFGPVVRIDGTGTVDAVHKAIVEHVTKII